MLDGYFYSVLYIVTNMPFLEQEVSPTIKYFLTFYIRLPVESQRLMIDLSVKNSLCRHFNPHIRIDMGQ